MNQAIEATGRAVLHPWLDAPEPTKAGPTPPPGWKSDAENWRNIQGFLGTMKPVKKAVASG